MLDITKLECQIQRIFHKEITPVGHSVFKKESNHIYLFSQEQTAYCQNLSKRYYNGDLLPTEGIHPNYALENDKWYKVESKLFQKPLKRFIT